MKSIEQNRVIRQCLSLLPTEEFSCPLLNYGYNKLSTEALLKLFVAAQLDQWESYAEMEEKLRAHPELRDAIGLKDISGSQVSRRINDLPTEWVQKLFVRVIATIKQLTQSSKGISQDIGRLNIVDATHLKLPEQLCDWAYVTKGWNVVKMHTRLVVTSPDTMYPDKIVPSNGIVSDHEGGDLLVASSDATYVMDRGYASWKRIDHWLEQGIAFVVRINKNARVFPMETYQSSDDPSVLRDVKVTFSSSKHSVRLIEFTDDHGRLYRLLTSRWDLTTEQIMEIYKNRWMIELFFKWIKQHLRLVNIWSTKPQGIWNQMFLALITYGLALIIKLVTRTTKTQWQLLRLIRTYLYKSFDDFQAELNRKKLKTSKGRQKVPISKKKGPVFVGNVALIKEKKKK